MSPRRWSRERESDATALRERAAVGVRQRIREHRERAPGSLRPVFDTLQQHLFDRGFNVTRLGALSGVGARNLSARFKPAVGWTPRDFIMACRLETAWSLVVGTDLKIEEIAAVLGYRSSQVFTDAFQRWYSVRPTTYRDQFSRMLQA